MRSICGESFKNDKELTVRVKDIRDKYPNKTKLSQNDFDFLKELLTYHSEYKAKIANGVCGMIVDGAKFDTRCFYIQKNDGKFLNFSFHHCIREWNKIKA